MKLYPLLFTILLLTDSTVVWANRLSPNPPKGMVTLSDRIQVTQNIVYKELDLKALKLDLYQPRDKTASQLPLVVYFHGAGYRKGSKNELLEIPFFRETLLELTEREQIIVASVNFRKGGKKAPLRSLLEDCREAIHWLRENAQKYQIDPGRIGLLGNTSGGHLALMIGLSKEPALLHDSTQHEAAPSVSFIIANAPPTDLVSAAKAVSNSEGAEEKKIQRQLKIGLGGTLDEVPENYANASPINFIRKNSPPMLIIIGQEDILFEQVKRFREVSEEAEANLQLIVVESAGAKVYEGFSNMSPTLPQLKDILQQFILEGFNTNSQ